MERAATVFVLLIGVGQASLLFCLQDLVEKVMILKKAVEASRGQTAECGDALSERLSLYAGMLASQGNLATAAVYLGNSSNDVSSRSFVHFNKIVYTYILNILCFQVCYIILYLHICSVCIIVYAYMCSVSLNCFVNSHSTE